MNTLRRPLAALAALGAAGGLAIATPSVASASVSTVSVTAAGVPCRYVSQIGVKKVVADLGMNAFTARQYKGYCTDAKGSAWMNFASVYVWQQYHVRGFAYRAYSGVNVAGELEPRGFTVSASRQQLSYSKPVRTIKLCTQGWGKLYRLGNESRQGMTTVRC